MSDLATADLRHHAKARAGDVRSSIARAGLVGKAMLYGLFALLAINIVTGSGSSSTQGAIERVAQGSFGRVILVALTLGLVGLTAWKVLQAIAGDPVEGSDPSDRLIFALEGASYAAVAAAAVGVLISNWSGSSSSGGGGDSKEEATATVLEWPGGRWLVMAAGLAIIGFALYEIYKHAVNSGFRERLVEVDEKVELAGRVGYGAKGAITAIAGGFLLIAGYRHDADQTKGISGVLQELADVAWGQVLLWLVAFGLILYALFCLAEAKFRRAT